MKKNLVLTLSATILLVFSVLAGDEKQKLLKQLSDLVAYTNLCMLKVLMVEKSRLPSDAPKTKNTLNKIENAYRKELENAIKQELKLRNYIRSKWPLFEELESMPSRARAKL
jgi:hypothetical protein